MDKLLNEMGTSYFWLTAVLLAFIVNVASSYAKSRLDALFNRYSTRWRERSAAKEKEIEESAAALAAHPDELPYVVASEMRRYLIGLYFLLISLLLFLVSTTPIGTGIAAIAMLVLRFALYGVGLFALVMSTYVIGTGIDEGAKLRRARELAALSKKTSLAD
jgi:hypothetical protein